MIRALTTSFAIAALLACGTTPADQELFDDQEVQSSDELRAPECCLAKAERFAANCGKLFGGDTLCMGGTQDDGRYEMQCTCSYDGGSAQATTECDPCPETNPV
jgi:hypothetical protein